jgi:hypothetical protein
MRVFIGLQPNQNYKYLSAQRQIEGRLKPIIYSDAVLCTDGASWYKTFAKQENIAHRRLITLDKKRVIGKAIFKT